MWLYALCFAWRHLPCPSLSSLPPPSPPIFLSFCTLSTVCECHGGEVRALPADLFMIWLLISFTGTWESASQTGLQAPLCESVHVCVGGKKTQNVLKCEHRCVLCVCAFVHRCVPMELTCNWQMRVEFRWFAGILLFFFVSMKLWHVCFGPVKRWTWWWSPIIGLWLSYWTTVGSHCVTADTNLLSSIGCGKECRRRCLVSVAGDCFVSQRACSVVCVSIWFIAVAYVFVSTHLTAR